MILLVNEVQYSSEVKGLINTNTYVLPDCKQQYVYKNKKCPPYSKCSYRQANN